jgi:hypothetical protein
LDSLVLKPEPSDPADMGRADIGRADIAWEWVYRDADESCPWLFLDPSKKLWDRGPMLSG